MTWIVVLFNEKNCIQNVPLSWFIAKNGSQAGRCWYPYSKNEFLSSKIHFNNDQITKMISKKYNPNNSDGTWFISEKIAGPFDKEIDSRKVAKEWSGTSNDCENESNCPINDTDYAESDDSNSSIITNVRNRKKSKRYSSKSFITQKQTLQFPCPPKKKLKGNIESQNKKRKICLQADHSSELITGDTTNDYSIAVESSQMAAESEDMKLLEVLNNSDDLSMSEFKDEHFCTDSIEDTHSNINQPIIIAIPSQNLHDDKTVDKNTMPNNQAEFVETTHVLPDNLNDTSCCCSLIKDLIKKQEQCFIQQIMTNSNQVKICNYLENLDKKINKLLESDKRTQNLSYPLPKLPAPFLELIPISSMANLEAVEKLLTPDYNFGHNAEEFKNFLLLKVATIKNFSTCTRTAFDFCMTREMAANFSFCGKTKQAFNKLHIFKVLRDAMSGQIIIPEHEKTFNKIIANILKHSGNNKASQQ
ncbi:uncharacterized protein LOC126896429 isoform X2 [Daktulosphaira vitifoliae]|uniref:uncharacterized protein LOC126896429 isoform X2 n=1 Tax=Daktulosphaira vitifoliae TaxID=58002 RepID=UPI0021AA015B|nr:uncharacterized protein LOC126896429 isoform X2 [Daktulosphaira vitifoliae]